MKKGRTLLHRASMDGSKKGNNLPIKQHRCGLYGDRGQVGIEGKLEEVWLWLGAAAVQRCRSHMVTSQESPVTTRVTSQHQSQSARTSSLRVLFWDGLWSYNWRLWIAQERQPSAYIGKKGKEMLKITGKGYDRVMTQVFFLFHFFSLNYRATRSNLLRRKGDRVAVCN